jgi:hypothetical protein
MIHNKVISWNQKQSYYYYFIVFKKYTVYIFFKLSDVYFRILISTKQSNLWGKTIPYNTSKCDIIVHTSRELS